MNMTKNLIITLIVFKMSHANSTQTHMRKKIMTTIKMVFRHIRKIIVTGKNKEITITINTKNQNAFSKSLSLMGVSLNGLC